jgi:2-polyprenyl-3-methyl-5-hydroxy-6-metoxy-1,4-benzoquinol methylase
MDWQALAQATSEEFISSPVSGGSPSRMESEINYLRNLQHTHVDTVRRVGERLTAAQCDQPLVLEMGAYFGVVSCALARGGVRVIAQDTADTMHLPLLQERFERERVGGQIVDDVSVPLPYDDATFDAIVCCEMLEHLPFNTVRLVRELRRILKPQGFAFLTVPNQASAKRRLQLLLGRPIRENMSAWIAAPQDDNWHWREYVASEFRELLQGGGFANIKLGYRHYTPPAHGNPVRRALVNFMYAINPNLMDDIHVFASA